MSLAANVERQNGRKSAFANCRTVAAGFRSRSPTSPLARDVLCAASICSATRLFVCLVLSRNASPSPGEPVPPDAAALVDAHRYKPARPIFRWCKAGFICSPCKTVAAVIRPGCLEFPCSRNKRLRAAAFHSAHDIPRSGAVVESTATPVRSARQPSLGGCSRLSIFGESPWSEPSKPTKPGFDGFVGSLFGNLALLVASVASPTRREGASPAPFSSAHLRIHPVASGWTAARRRRFTGHFTNPARVGKHLHGDAREIRRVESTPTL